MKERIITPTTLKTKDIEEVISFDPKKEYPWNGKGIFMTAKIRSRKINEISRLIANMVALGASTDELVRAMKYMMVLNDAIKYSLDCCKAFVDFGITGLVATYGTGSIEYKLEFVYHDEEE